VVKESDGDLMGDGVNIAARLEGIALPGAICLSEDAYRQLREGFRLRQKRHADSAAFLAKAVQANPVQHAVRVSDRRSRVGRS